MESKYGTPLQKFHSRIKGVFEFDKVSGLSLIQLHNFLNHEQYAEMEMRESGFLTCDSGLDHVNLTHYNI